MAPIGTHDWWPDAPWHERIAGRPVDVERTARFAGENLRVRCSPTTPLDACGAAPSPVYLSKRPGAWWKPLPAIRVPLPPVVHMNLRNPDAQVFFIDEEAGRYYELSAFRPTPWFHPYRWACDGAYAWDLNEPWESQPGGTSASDIPVWPLVPTYEQLAEDGHVGHALAFVCAGVSPSGASDGYSSDPPVGYARATDGRIKDHPIRAGEVLRLRPDRAPKPRNRQEQTVIETLTEYGAVNTDMTSDSHSIRMPYDARLDLALALTASMFEVVAA
jgi:hypothetical protein